MRKMGAAECMVAAVVAVIAVQVAAWMLGEWIDWLVRK